MVDESVIKIGNASIYQGNKLILKDINITINKGEFVYLIGKTGSGKSSLLKTLYADIPAKKGSFIIAGYDLTTIKKKDIPFLRRKIGIIFQDFQLLFDRSVEDNLSFVLRATGWTDDKKISKKIDEVLALTGLLDKKKRMPHQLSGGEQQSLVIARSLLNDPEVIIADEPTGNLDPETTNDVMMLLMKINKEGKTILMATHNYNLLLKFSARILRCTEGRVTD